MTCVTVGTCSLCGGAVRIPAVWMGTIPPSPTCSQCGAVSHGPVIDMAQTHTTTPIGRRKTDVPGSVYSDIPSNSTFKPSFGAF